MDRGRAAPALEVSAEERGELERLIRRHATAQQIAPRARVILLSAEGLKVGESAARLGVWRETVSQGRARWRSSSDTSAEARERSGDAPRSGAPARIKPEQACAIIALTCETNVSRAFGAGHRITVHFTPRHASWLKQIEIWFSILARKLIQRGNFTSRADLGAKINAFIDVFNKTMAKPFKWTWAGKPLTI